MAPLMRSACLSTLLLLALSTCSWTAKLHRVDDPEDLQLRRAVSGIVLQARPVGELLVTRVEAHGAPVVPEGWVCGGNIAGVSPVSRDGFLVYVENRGPRRSLVRRNLDPDVDPGTPVAGQSAELQEHLLGAIALSEDAGTAVLSWNPARTDGHLHGELSAVSLGDGRSRRLLDLACVERLAFRGPEVIVAVPAPAAPEEWRERGGGESHVVLGVDVGTGETWFVAGGHLPVLSPDGSWLLSRRDDGTSHLHDLAANRAPARIELPGALTEWFHRLVGPLALSDDLVVVYYGRPAAGRPLQVTERFSPMVGPRELGVLRAARIGEQGSCTVHEGIDPRRAFGFTFTAP